MQLHFAKPLHEDVFEKDIARFEKEENRRGCHPRCRKKSQYTTYRLAQLGQNGQNQKHENVLSSVEITSVLLLPNVWPFAILVGHKATSIHEYRKNHGRSTNRTQEDLHLLEARCCS
jgi:hypothetical protein